MSQTIDLQASPKSQALSTGMIAKILVVDDEPSLRNILVQSLNSQNYDASAAASGAEALEKLSVEDFDLVLSDLMMPEMDGLTLLQHALEIDPYLVAIMMTGQGTIQTAVDAMKRGAFDYVLKPFRLETMMPVLTRAINTRRLRLENVQLREAVAIHELSQTIAFTLDPQTLLSKLADTALQQSEADEVSVLLPTADGKELYVAAVRGEKRERLLGERIPFDRSIASWVGHEMQPVLLNGEVRDARFEALWPRPEISSSISVPMQVANKLVGVLNLNVVERRRRFTLGQMKALTILAGTAAAGLESASLYAQVLEAEKNYRSIFEYSAEGIFQANHQGRYISVNPAMARILGYDSPRDLIDSVSDISRQVFVCPEACAEALRQIETEGSVKELEVEAYRKDGEKIWLSMNIRAVNLDAGAPYCEGTIEDITERKRADAALRESEERYRDLVENAHDIIYSHDLEGNYTSVNTVVEQITGFTAEEALKLNLENTIAPDYLGRAQDLLVRIRAGERVTAYELEMVAKDGHRVPMEINSRLMLRDGVPIGVQGIARDITERKRAEAERAQMAIEIENQRRRLDNIISSVPGVVWEAWGKPDEATQRIDFVSDYVEPMLGYSVDEWLSTPNFWLTIVHPDDKEAAAQKAAEGFAGGTNSTMEFRWLAKDGREIWVESNWVVIKDDEGQPVGLRGVNTDISERKQAEAELRFQKTLLESQTEASIDGILVVSSDRKLLSFNRRFIDMWGISEETLGSQSDQTALQTVIEKVEDPQAFLDGIEYLYQHPEETSQHEIHLQDGRTFDRYSAPIKSAGGEYYGRVWFFHDITERKQREAELRASEERYRDLVENAHDIIYSHDLQGNYTSSNKAGEEITGYTLEESLKLNLVETIAPEYVDKAREMLARKLAHEEVTAYELELIAKDGHRVPIEVSTRLVIENGVPVGVAGIARDITDRKLAEAELRRLAAAVEQTADSIVITDVEGNIEYVNPAFERITGYSRKEALGQNPRLLKSSKNDPAIYQDLWKTILGGGVWVGQLVNRKKDGTEFYEQVTISAVHDESGKIVNYVAVKQDTTAQIKLQEQLRQSQKLEAIGQLAGGVAHDFNNLLTAINGYSSLTLKRLNDEDPIKSYVEEIKKAGDRAANLTRQLLAFGRKQILQPLALNLNEVITDMSKMLQRLIGEDIRLTTALDPGLLKIKADPGQMEQVLVNLVVNARDAMPQGGKLTIETASLELDLSDSEKHVGLRTGRCVMMAVSDTGVGMSIDTRERIFEPFFTTKEKGKGTGLGLSTVYGIVKQSGGNVSVYSEPGVGTTFKVYLPQFFSEGRTTEPSPVEATVPSGAETILLVEDEDMVRGIARRVLEDAGYHVLDASGGAEAIRVCQEYTAQIDLLLTDVVMPGFSGKETAQRLTALRPATRVLFMSGYTDEAIVHHGVLDSNVEFIQKPFAPSALAKKVREVLDGKGGRNGANQRPGDE